MADEIDKTQETTEFYTQNSINEIRARADQRDAESIGACLYCFEPQPDGRRWCDKYCRDHWEADRKKYG